MQLAHGHNLLAPPFKHFAAIAVFPSSIAIPMHAAAPSTIPQLKMQETLKSSVSDRAVVRTSCGTGRKVSLIVGISIGGGGKREERGC